MESRKEHQKPIHIAVNVKRPKRFKAGAELSGAVNLVNVTTSVDLNDVQHEVKVEVMDAFESEEVCD